MDRLRAAGCVFAEDEARLLVTEARTAAELEAMVERRAAGEPVEHILGWAQFYGLRIHVDPGVFVPRRRTELLAQQAITLVQQAAAIGSATQAAGAATTRSPDTDQTPPAAAPEVAGSAARTADAAAIRPPGARRPPHAADTDGDITGSAASTGGEAPARRPVVVDLCCGSGALGAAVAAACGSVEVHAVDLDPAAVRCARLNLAGGDRHVYQGDLDEPLPDSLRGRVDVLVANAPYVPTAAVGLLPPEARLHEPRTALDGGADGLDILRRVIATAPRWLAPGGHLLVEASAGQAPGGADAMARCGLVPRVVGSPDLDATVVIGTSPVRASPP